MLSHGETKKFHTHTRDYFVMRAYTRSCASKHPVVFPARMFFGRRYREAININFVYANRVFFFVNLYATEYGLCIGTVNVRKDKYNIHITKHFNISMYEV